MHSGWQLACAMWGMTGLSITLVFLRLYTRIRIVKFVGAEDYMYTLTGVCYSFFFTYIHAHTSLLLLTLESITAVPPWLYYLHSDISPLWTRTELLATERTEFVRRDILDLCRQQLRYYWKCNGQAFNGTVPSSSRSSEMA